MSGFMKDILALFNVTGLEDVLTTFTEGVSSIWDSFCESGSSIETRGIVDSAFQYLEYVYNDFDDLQIALLKTLLLVFLATLFLIYLSWYKYGDRIYERFMRPATSESIEKLKESVSRLKLPKEHTPRI